MVPGIVLLILDSDVVDEIQLNDVCDSSGCEGGHCQWETGD